MDPVTAALIAMLVMLVIGGVWGTMIIRNILEQRSARLGRATRFEPLQEVVEEYRQLEVRLGRLEEEVAFLRELRAPKAPGKLPPGGNAPEVD